MTEESSRGPLAVLAIVGLAFVVVILFIRLDTVNGELEAVSEERNEARAAEAAATSLAGGLEDALDAARREIRVKAEQEELALANAQAAVDRAAAGRVAAEALLEALRTDRERIRADRDRAEASRIETADRLARIESALIVRERELAAARAELKSLREPTKVDVQRRRLAHDDDRVRVDAIRRLEALRAEKGAVEALRVAFRTSRSVEEAQAVLRAAGVAEARELARAEVSNESIVVRCAAATALRDVGHLENLLRDEDPRVRIAAARRVGEIRLTGAGVVLSSRHGDTDPGVRAAAAVALARLGRWTTVGDLMADPDARVARAALQGWVEAGRPIPADLRPNPAIENAVALGRRLSHRSVSD